MPLRGGLGPLPVSAGVGFPPPRRSRASQPGLFQARAPSSRSTTAKADGRVGRTADAAEAPTILSTSHGSAVTEDNFTIPHFDGAPL